MEKELQIIYNKIKNKENFAFVRFGDGEANIISNVPCNRKGFHFNPSHKPDIIFREELKKSFHFNDKNYYKGVDKKEKGRNVLSPRVFVNQNYLDFLNNFSPLFEGCTFVGNEKGAMKHLPFKPESYLRIKNNAWKDTESLLVEIALSYCLCEEKNKIVLVAGGAYSNVLIHKLYKMNPNHIYIDVGSVYDPFLFGTNTRQYHERLEPKRR